MDTYSMWRKVAFQRLALAAAAEKRRDMFAALHHRNSAAYALRMAGKERFES